MRHMHLFKYISLIEQKYNSLVEEQEKSQEALRALAAELATTKEEVLASVCCFFVFFQSC